MWFCVKKSWFAIVQAFFPAQRNVVDKVAAPLFNIQNQIARRRQERLELPSDQGIDRMGANACSAPTILMRLPISTTIATVGTNLY